MSDFFHPAIPELELPSRLVPMTGELFRGEFEFTVEFIEALGGFPQSEVEKDLLSIVEFGAEHSEKLFEAVDAGLVPAEKLDPIAIGFVPRALFLMADLGMTESIGRVLKAMGNAKGFERWVASDVGRGLWQVFYSLGRKEPEALVTFAGSDADERLRMEAVNALGQLAMHEPGWRDQVGEWMGKLLNICLEDEQKQALVATHAVMVLRDLRIEGSFSLIRKVDKAGLCIHALCGSMDELEKNIRTSLLEFAKREVLDLLTLFRGRKVYGTDAPFSPKEASSILNIRSGKLLKQKKAPKKQIGTIRRKTQSKFGKVGRNDPCPCGSGKKYKKCHGK